MLIVAVQSTSREGLRIQVSAYGNDWQTERGSRHASIPATSHENATGMLCYEEVTSELVRC